jgi:hypothetical protein
MDNDSIFKMIVTVKINLVSNDEKRHARDGGDAVTAETKLAADGRADWVAAAAEMEVAADERRDTSAYGFSLFLDGRA